MSKEWKPCISNSSSVKNNKVQIPLRRVCDNVRGFYCLRVTQVDVVFHGEVLVKVGVMEFGLTRIGKTTKEWKQL